MALNDKQVNLYMTHRRKGKTQAVAAAKAGISVRSGRRIEKGQRSPVGHRHWRTRQDPLEEVWEDVIGLCRIKASSGNMLFFNIPCP
ncbi:TPA: helix-turn-helix domain-containing protein [Serratia marcescens]|nr:helix-turn-helix domain-containing protein [Serratia marcescens]